MRSQPIFEGRCITISTITDEAAEFFAGLDPRERRDLKVTATILDNSLCRGRPPGGRAERVTDSAAGLWELRITPPGRRGRHTRALYVCERRELLLVRGFRKAGPGLPRSELEAAERDARAYWGRSYERRPRRGRRRAA